jgi:hypothetical protein
MVKLRLPKILLIEVVSGIKLNNKPLSLNLRKFQCPKTVKLEATDSVVDESSVSKQIENILISVNQF